MIALYLYWFGFANRHLVFLYEHDMGGPDTSPFSAVTSSRYWMTGFVAGGIMLLAALLLGWRRVRLDWRSSWLGLALPLLIAIPIITMTVNSPRLPPGLAAATATVAALAMGVALWPLTLVDWEREDRFLLFLDGLILGGFLFGLTILQASFNRSGIGATILLGSLILIGAALAAVAPIALHWWRDREVASPVNLVAATFSLGYLAANLAHYLIFANGYFYISSSGNYFAPSWLWQLIVWFLFGGIAVLYSRWGNRVVAQNRPDPTNPNANTYY